MLPDGESCGAQFSAERLQHTRVMAHVHSDLLCDLVRYLPVTFFDGTVSATSQRVDRDQSVQNKWEHRRRRDQEDKSRGYPPHLETCVGLAAGRQSQRLVRMSRLPSGATSNVVSTARDVSCQARNAAGGSSCRTRARSATACLTSSSVRDARILSKTASAA